MAFPSYEYVLKILSLFFLIKHLNLTKNSQNINCHSCSSFWYFSSSKLFPLINQFSGTRRRFLFVPMAINKVFPGVKDTPKIKERHGILCIIWSYFLKIIWHRYDVKKIDIESRRYFLAVLTDTSVFVSILHIFNWDA